MRNGVRIKYATITYIIPINVKKPDRDIRLILKFRFNSYFDNPRSLALPVCCLLHSDQLIEIFDSGKGRMQRNDITKYQ